MSIKASDKGKQVLSDLESLEILYKTYHALLCEYVYRIVSDQMAAEDIVQNFFIRLWEKQMVLMPESEFKPYAYQSVKNAGIDYLRKKERTDLLLQHMLRDSDDVADESSEFIYRQQVREALQKVPYKSRKVFGLGCISGLKYGEIASVMNISVNTVKSQMAVAFRILREELKDFKCFLL